jgi:hypothetical protein
VPRVTERHRALEFAADTERSTMNHLYLLLRSYNDDQQYNCYYRAMSTSLMKAFELFSPRGKHHFANTSDIASLLYLCSDVSVNSPEAVIDYVIVAYIEMRHIAAQMSRVCPATFFRFPRSQCSLSQLARGLETQVIEFMLKYLKSQS